MKNKFITFSFIIILSFFLITNIISKDKEISFLERRTLSRFPYITINSILKGNVFEKLENYSLDQFPLRDSFRKLKVFTEFEILKKSDSNNIFIENEKIFKINYPLNKKSLEDFVNKLNSLYEKYLKEMNVYYSIIPDKNYYLLTDDYLTLDYDYLFDYIKSNLNNMEYIDISNYLNIDSYYNTDIHWRQDKLIPIIEVLSKNMNFKINNMNYTKNNYYPFYGSYYGYAPINIKADTLTYLNNSTINAAIVKNYDNSISSIYNLDKLGSIDSYDVFLSGATPFIEITNTNYKSGKELIIFRDSFGSSLAPLLIDGYSKITLIDLRYISPSLLDTIIKFNNQDILILYNTLIINNSSIIKN